MFTQKTYRPIDLECYQKVTPTQIFSVKFQKKDQNVLLHRVTPMAASDISKSFLVLVEIKK